MTKIIPMGVMAVMHSLAQMPAVETAVTRTAAETGETAGKARAQGRVEMAEMAVRQEMAAREESAEEKAERGVKEAMVAQPVGKEATGAVAEPSPATVVRAAKVEALAIQGALVEAVEQLTLLQAMRSVAMLGTAAMDITAQMVGRAV